MAVVVVSNSGGSIADGATYIGGVPPTADDTIAFTITSGNLDVDSLVNISGIDFTNCISVILFTQPINLNNAISKNYSINLGTGGYTISGAPEIIFADTRITTNLTLTANGVHWGGILRINSSTSNSTITFTDIWNQDGEFAYTSGISFSFLTGTFNINGICNNIGSDFLISSSSTATVNFNGSINFDILSVGGGSVNFIGGTFPAFYLGLTPTGNPTINFGSKVFTDVVIGTGIGSITLNSLLNATNITFGTVTLTFLGTHGFNVGNVIFPISTVNLVFNSLIEYFINTSINTRGIVNISSTTPLSKAKITFGQNIDQTCVANINATDIDSSDGRRVNNFYGTAINCDNWRIWNDNTLPQASYTF